MDFLRGYRWLHLFFWRNSVGVNPVIFLKTVLKVIFEINPASKLTDITVYLILCRFWNGSRSRYPKEYPAEFQSLK